MNHVSMLKHQGIIATWQDEEIPAGDVWSEEIGSHLESAQIILLLISPDFLASKYCYDVEMKRAVERHDLGQARVIPIFLRPCDWSGAPFGKLQGLPANAEPVTSGRWSSQDEAFKVIAEGIRKTIERFARIEVGSPSRTTVNSLAAEKLVALHQLPPPTAEFTGRADELKELLKAVKKQGIAITGVHGMGGVGKTALALKIADHLKEHYPDGQIYLDLKGVEKSPLLPKEAMAHVIRSFDLATKAPESEAEVTALYRSVLHNKKALLLMDNAKDEQQVKPLVPPDGSLLIVTSRQHFVLPGLFDKNLDVLSKKDAADLLSRIAPRLKKEKPETIAELARLCGFLPLALEAVANALRVRVNIAAPEYAAQLKDARERLKLTAADASLELSYQLLIAEMQQRFRMLAVFPDTFDAAAATAVWEVKLTAAKESLGELLLYSLVEFSETTSRYRLHDLVRLFADTRLAEKEREAAQRRHAGHYLSVLGSADDLYKKGGDSVLKGLALFDAEWGNIQAGQVWVATHSESDDIAAEWCSRFPLSGVHCLLLRQHPRDRIVWLESALQALSRLKNRGREGPLLGNLGIAYDDLGECRRAIEHHESHLKITRETGDRQGEGQALGNLGLAYDELGEYHRAIEYQEQRLKIVREIGDRLGEGQALGNLGIAYYSLGEYRRAIEYQEQRLEITREIGDRLGESQALGNLGGVYLGLGEHLNAIEYYDQQLQIAREIGDRLGEGNALGGLGISYESIGEYQRAIEYYDRQLRISRTIGDRLGEANALWNSSFALDKMGDRANVTALAEAALKIYEAIESPFASTARDQLAEWREEEKARGQATE